MDVVWIVLDSLSYGVTPFARDGPDTMPILEALADERGVVFEHAYVPGPSSPSSHGSFFTGQFPSETGMHEAFPYLSKGPTTIAEVLGDTHESLLISANPYLSNGLGRGFDEVNDLLRAQYMVFPSGNDPKDYASSGAGLGKLTDYVEFVRDGGTPIRSLTNGLAFKWWNWRDAANIPREVADDALTYQYAETMNRRIRAFLAEADSEAFVVANYMDIHPPLDASDEALARFADGYRREDLPIGRNGQEIYERIQADPAYDGTDMYRLLQAAVWDTDRRLGPLVRDLVADGTFVVLTADHGIWFRRARELDEERLHVPLIVFGPEVSPRTVPHTVNILSLPATTFAALDRQGMEFDADATASFRGEDVLGVTEDTLSLTEFIHNPEAPGSPVDPDGAETADIRHDIAAIRGDARVDLLDGELEAIRGDAEAVEALREQVRAHKAESRPKFGTEAITYDASVRDRLEAFGYL